MKLNRHSDRELKSGKTKLEKQLSGGGMPRLKNTSARTAVEQHPSRIIINIL